jgi:hypothetical protein
MRAAAIALVVVLGGALAPEVVQAAPTAPQEAIVPDVSPNIVQIAGGCGRGWHPVRYRDRWGYWRTRCVRNYY